VDLVVLVITGAAVYFVVTGVNRWWNGYRERHNVVLQVVTLTVVVVVVVWASQSSTGARIADLAFTAFLVLVAAAVVASLVTGQRRIKSRQAMMSRAAAVPQPAPRSRSRSWKSDDDVYAIGAFDARTNELRAIKIGWTARGERVREAEVEEEQLGRMNISKRLGRGPGGERREQRMLTDLAEWRYPRSEWFEPSPEVVAAVGELERLTEDGRALVRSTATRSRMTRAQSSTVAS